MTGEGTGWELVYPRDILRLDRLPGLTTNAGNPSPRTIALRQDLPTLAADAGQALVTAAAVLGPVRGHGVV